MKLFRGFGVNLFFKKHHVAISSLSAQLIRGISGPITLLLLSATLSTEEMGFYFTFLSIAAMQQLMEAGLGFTIIQYIAHAYVLSDDGSWSTESKAKIKSYTAFTFIWFACISLFILFGVSVFGFWFYSGYIGGVDWRGPWLAMVLAIVLNAALMPIQIFLEGTQQQSLVYGARLKASLAYAVSIWLAILSDMGLYSISVALVASAIALSWALLPVGIKCITQCWPEKRFWSLYGTLLEVWPMLSKISVTWILGYFFWNSFSLVAFRLLDATAAGKIGFTFSLARAGFTISESILISQNSIYGDLISKNEINTARRRFKMYFSTSLFILIVGYTMFSLIILFFPEFYIMEKMLKPVEVVQVFLYFIVLLPITSQANFCRAFKYEPYFHLSLVFNILIPLTFIVFVQWFVSWAFLAIALVSIPILFWSNMIYHKVICLPRDVVNRV